MYMDDQKIISLLSKMQDSLSTSCWEAAAKAIMTTDTFPKGATRKAMIGDQEVFINGIAKGKSVNPKTPKPQNPEYALHY